MILQTLRTEIDKIDYQIHDLLNERAKIALQIGRLKVEQEGNKVNFHRPEREQQILEEISTHNRGPLSNEAIHTIFKNIMSECRSLQSTYHEK
jgi:chorismate mutase/prephenate dehydratase